MNFKGIGWDGLQWIHLGLGCGQMAGSCVHGNEYSDSGKKKKKREILWLADSLLNS